MAEISTKLTKQEIIDSYQDLLKKYENIKNNTLLKDDKKETKQIKLEIKESDIFSEIESIKLSFIKELSNITTTLSQKIEEIKNLEENIENEKKYLEQVLWIKTQAESLYALIDMQKQKQDEFEQEMNNKKREFKKQEDEWKFNFDQLKQKETYEQEIKKEEQKRRFEQEIQKKIDDLKIREEEIKTKETEYKKLEQEVVRLEKELENISSKLEEQITDKIKSEFDREKILLLKDFELKEKMYEIENKNLSSKIEELQKQNTILQKAVDNSTQKIEQLASKVVESSRPVFYDRNWQEKNNV